MDEKTLVGSFYFDTTEREKIYTLWKLKGDKLNYSKQKFDIEVYNRGLTATELIIGLWEVIK